MISQTKKRHNFNYNSHTALVRFVSHSWKNVKVPVPYVAPIEETHQQKEPHENPALNSNKNKYEGQFKATITRTAIRTEASVTEGYSLCRWALQPWKQTANTVSYFSTRSFLYPYKCRDTHIHVYPCIRVLWLLHDLHSFNQLFVRPHTSTTVFTPLSSLPQLQYSYTMKQILSQAPLESAFVCGWWWGCDGLQTSLQIWLMTPNR